MRVEVYEPDAEPEKVLRLRLKEAPDGVSVISVSADGVIEQTICRFSHSGHLTRWPLDATYADEHGIELAEKRRIMLSES